MILTNSLTKNSTKEPVLVVICGPTATGKSGLAIALAKRLDEAKRVDSAILSADSRQVYREFNIGTAKPTLADQQQVAHYLIDICDPTETLTVAEYQQQTRGLIEGVRDQALGVSSQESGVSSQEFHPSHPPVPVSPCPGVSLLVGGTGLYIRSIVRGLKIPRVPPQPELRSQLQTLGQPQLYAFLQQVDPESAVKIHPNDQVRTLRSLEVFYVTGRPMSDQQGEQPPAYPILQIGLDCQDTALLDRRIERRTGQMVTDGFVDEVHYLCQKYGADLPLLNTLGYAEFKSHLAGEMSLDQAISLTVLHTRQFAKRQRTWFRADLAIEWFDADSPDLLEQVWQRVQQFLVHHR